MLKQKSAVMKKHLLLILLCASLNLKTFSQIFVVDTTFNRGIGPAKSSHKTIIQPDGKILLKGQVGSYDGVVREVLTRLHEDGSIDTSFANKFIVKGRMDDFVLLADGKIILTTTDTVYDGTAIKNIIRINSDGSIDESFNFGNSGPNGYSEKLLLQPDGKILLEGTFTEYNGVAVKRLIRIDNNGAIDPSFTYAMNSGSVLAMKYLSDGKILVSAAYSYVADSLQPRMIRLHSDGSRDTTFNYGKVGNDMHAHAMDIQSDGKIIIVGEFEKYNDKVIKGIARLNPDGSLDETFNGGVNGYVGVNLYDVKVTSDDKILVGGFITSYNNVDCSGLIALNADGSLNNSFYNMVLNKALYSQSMVSGISIQADNKIVISGSFRTYIGNFHVARLIVTDSSACNVRVGVTNVYNVSCTANGSASAIGYNGVQPYSYEWKNAFSYTDSIAEFDTAKTYKCIVTDGLGCKDSVEVLISEPQIQSDFDLSTEIIMETFRPGVNSTTRLLAYNNGCATKSGQLKFIIPDSLTFDSASVVPDFIHGDTLIWNFTDLQHQIKDFKVDVNLTVSTQSQMNDTILMQSFVTPLVLDVDSTNNSQTSYSLVRNSYDPNDISVNPSGECEEAYVKKDQLLTYTVRFQNTGNAEAININVVDSLDINLDLNTLRIISASDTMHTVILKNNAIKFVFTDIWLADSNSNEPKSHGYVIYEIKVKSSVSNGTIISNKAEIFFDYNPAVLTNVVQNTIYTGDNHQPCKPSNNFITNATQHISSLYPNPTSDNAILNIVVSQNTLVAISVYNLLGEKFLTKNVSLVNGENQIPLSTSGLSNGVYFVLVNSSSLQSSTSLVIQR